MPGTVRLGAWLFCITYILLYVVHPRIRVTVAMVKVDDAAVADSPFPIEALLGTLLALAMLITPFWLLFRAVKRQPWARVALAVVAILLLVIVLEAVRAYGGTDRQQWGIWLADAALELVALALFFTPSANRWYRAARR